MTGVEFSSKATDLTISLKPYAIKLTRDVEDANDLIQETMMKAYNNRDKFAEGTNLKAWMYTIMKNTFITNYQRMVRRKTFIDTTENLHFINSSDSITKNNADQNFALTDINKAVGNLQESYKVPFMMHFNGFKYHEIADELNIPIGTVKNRIHIARKDLKDKLRVYATKN